MSGGEADFIVALEVAPRGLSESVGETARATGELSSQTRSYGESTRMARTAADELAAAQRRQLQDASALAEATQRNITGLAEYYRTLQAGGTAAAAGINQRVAMSGLPAGSEAAGALQAQLQQEQLLKEAIRQRAEQQRQADAVAANLSAMRARTAELQRQLAEYQALGPAAARAAAAIRAQVASTGATAGSPAAAEAEREAVAQQQLETQIQQTIAARERAIASAREEAAAYAADAASATFLSRALEQVLTAVKFLVVMGAALALVSWFKGAISESIQLEDSLTRLKTLVGVNAQEVDSYRESIREISLATGQSADENAKAMFAITSSGLRGEAALRALQASAEGAAVGLGDQTTVARAAVAAMVAYGAGNLSAKQALDVLIATAREGNTNVEAIAGSFGRVTGIAATVGVKFSDLGAAVASFTRLGVSADEAVTGLRGTLAALTLKEARTADAALKSVGLSVKQLREVIQTQGLAQALVLLVSKFDGNNDALAKVIPNIRALSEVLANAKSNAGEYVAIQDRVNASIGHATDDAFKLQQSNPAFIFRQLSAAVAEAGRDLVSEMIPTLVHLSDVIKTTTLSGDWKGWGETLGRAFRIVGGAAEVLIKVLVALVPLLPFVEAYLGIRALQALQTALINLAAVAAANPFTAVLVGLLALVVALNAAVSADKALDQAFLDENARINQTSLALASLRSHYDLATAAKARLSGVAAAAGSGAVVLRSSEGTYLGDLERIEEAYRRQAAAAGSNKTALEAAKIARDRDTAALEAHTQAFIDDSAAAVHNAEVQLASETAAYTAANERLQQLRDAARNKPTLVMGEMGMPVLSREAAAVKQAEQQVTQLGSAIKAQSREVANSKAFLEAEQKALDANRAARKQETATVESASAGRKKANEEIEKSIALKEVEARNAAIVAAAQLRGAEAVRQATIAAQADRMIEEERQRLIKSGLSAKEAAAEVERLYAQRIRDAVRSISDSNLQGQRNQAVYQKQIELEHDALEAEARLQDAKAGNNQASQLAAARIAAENEALRQNFELHGADAENLVREAQARVQEKIFVEQGVKARGEMYQATQKWRRMEAELADAQNRSTDASREAAVQIEIDAKLREKGALAGSAWAAQLANDIRLDHQKEDSLKARTAAQIALNAAEDAQKKARAEAADWRQQQEAVRAYGADLAGILQQYGLLSDATRQLAIEEQALALSRVAGEKRSKEEIAAELQGQQLILENLKRVQAAQEIVAYTVQPIRDAWQQFGTDFKAALADWITTGKASWKDLAESLLRSMVSAIIEMVVRWVAAHRVMQAEAMRTAAVNAAAAGAGGGGGYVYNGGVNGASAVGLGSSAAGMGGWSLAAPGGAGWGGLFGGAGWGGGTAGAFGAVGAWAGVFAVVYMLGSQWIRTHKEHMSAVDFRLMEEGKLAATMIQGESGRVEAMTSQLSAAGKIVTDFISGLGGVMTSLEADIAVRRKGQGSHTDWRVFVDGIATDFGRDMDAAMQFAAVQAAKHASYKGLDPITLAAIQRSTQEQWDKFQADVQLAQRVALMGKSQGAQAMDSVIAEAQNLAAEMLRILGPSEEFRQAISNINAQLVQSLQDQRDQLTGRQRTAEEDYQLRLQQASLWSAELNLRKADVALKVIQARADLAAYDSTRHLIGGTGGEGGRGGGGGIMGVARAAAVAAGSMDLFAAAISGTGDAARDALVANLAALEALQQALDQIQPIDPSEVSRGTGGGSGGDRAQNQRDLRDQVSRLGLSDLTVSILDTRRRFSDLADSIRHAGFSEAERERLLAAAAAGLTAELDHLRQQQLDASQAFLRAGTPAGGSLMDGLRGVDRTQRDLIQANRDLFHQGLLSLREMRDLNNALRDAGDRQRRQMIGDAGNQLLMDLYGYLGMEREAAQLKFDLTVAELRMRRAELELAMRTYGMLDTGLLATLDDLIGRVVAAGPAIFQAGGGGAGGTIAGSSAWQAQQAANEAAANAAQQQAQAAASALQTLQGIEDTFLDPFAQAVKKVNDQFAGLRDVLGDTERVQRDYARSIQQVISQFLDPVRQYRAGLQFAQASPVPVERQYAAAQAQFQGLISELMAGNFSRVGRLTETSDLVISLMQKMFPEGSTRYRELYAQLQQRLDQFLALYPGQAPPPTGALPPPGSPGGSLPGGLPSGPPESGTASTESRLDRIAAILEALAGQQPAEMQVLRDIRDAAEGTESAAQATYGVVSARRGDEVP